MQQMTSDASFPPLLIHVGTKDLTVGNFRTKQVYEQLSCKKEWFEEPELLHGPWSEGLGIHKRVNVIDKWFQNCAESE